MVGADKILVMPDILVHLWHSGTENFKMGICGFKI